MLHLLVCVFSSCWFGDMFLFAFSSIDGLDICVRVARSASCLDLEIRKPGPGNRQYSCHLARFKTQVSLNSPGSDPLVIFWALSAGTCLISLEDFSFWKMNCGSKANALCPKTLPCFVAISSFARGMVDSKTSSASEIFCDLVEVLWRHSRR